MVDLSGRARCMLPLIIPCSRVLGSSIVGLGNAHPRGRKQKMGNLDTQRQNFFTEEKVWEPPRESLSTPSILSQPRLLPSSRSANSIFPIISFHSPRLAVTFSALCQALLSADCCFPLHLVLAPPSLPLLPSLFWPPLSSPFLPFIELCQPFSLPLPFSLCPLSFVLCI